MANEHHPRLGGRPIYDSESTVGPLLVIALAAALVVVMLLLLTSEPTGPQVSENTPKIERPGLPPATKP